MSKPAGTYQGAGTGRPVRRKRRARNSRAKTRRRQKRPPPITHEVLGLRCRVREVLLLDQMLVLTDEGDGRDFDVPLGLLVGRDALAQIEQGEAVWLSVRREMRRVRRMLGRVVHEDDDGGDEQGA